MPLARKVPNAGMPGLPLWSDPIPQLIDALRRLEAEPRTNPGAQARLEALRLALARRRANPKPGDIWPQQLAKVSDLTADVRDVLKLLSTPRASAHFLEQTLQRASQEIFNAVLEYDSRPKRSNLREKLVEIKSSAEHIARLLRHEDIINADLDLENVVQFREGLDFSGALTRLSREVANALIRVEVGPGTQNAAPSFHLANPRLLCAHIVIKAWEQVRKKKPDPKTIRAQEACAVLWQVSGQQGTAAVERGDIANSSSWQRHLTDARKGDPPSKEGRRKHGELPNPRDHRNLVCQIVVDRVFSKTGTES